MNSVCEVSRRVSEGFSGGCSPRTAVVEGVITSISAEDARHILLLHKPSVVAGSSSNDRTHLPDTGHHTRHHVVEEARHKDQALGRTHRGRVDRRRQEEARGAVREEAESGSCCDESSSHHVALGSDDGSLHGHPGSHVVVEARGGHHNSHLRVGNRLDGMAEAIASDNGRCGPEPRLEPGEDVSVTRRIG